MRLPLDAHSLVDELSFHRRRNLRPQQFWDVLDARENLVKAPWFNNATRRDVLQLYPLFHKQWSHFGWGSRLGSWPGR